MGSGCGNLIAEKNSFVCHSTPHFDSTSRKASYSVPPYHTPPARKCKSLFCNSGVLNGITPKNACSFRGVSQGRRCTMEKNLQEERNMQCQKLKTYMQTGRVVFLPPKAITPNPAQPRKVFDPEGLEELAQSIRQHGILQPLSVRRVGVSYQLIAGERRLRAGILAGLTEIPCLLMTMDDRESGLTALVENLQRQDLHYIEEAQALSTLITAWSMSQEQAARTVGKSQSAVANKLRLLRHSGPVLEALRSAALTERHARALLKLPGEPEKLRAIAVIAAQGMGVAQAERYVEGLLAQAPAPARQPDVKAFLKHLSAGLSRIQSAGIPAVSERRETDSQIVFTITIPK